MEYGASTVDDFCARVGIGKTLFYKEVNEKRLKVVHLGRKTLIRDEDAQEWLRSLPDGLHPLNVAESRAPIDARRQNCAKRRRRSGDVSAPPSAVG